MKKTACIWLMSGFLSCLLASSVKGQSIFGFPNDPNNNDNQALNAPVISRSNNVDGTNTFLGGAGYSQLVVSDNYGTGPSPTENNTMFVYPNPVINSTRIVLGYEAPQDVIVAIIDLDGHILRMYQFPAGTQQMDIDMEFVRRQGVYSISVFQKNMPVLSTRVVKE
jgi:hypothetical protein